MAVLVQSDNVKKLKASFVPNMMTAAQVREPGSHAPENLHVVLQVAYKTIRGAAQ